MRPSKAALVLITPFALAVACSESGPSLDSTRNAAQPTPQTCTSDRDCTSGICTGVGECRSAEGINGLRDGDETDVDCGGSVSPKCKDGKTCSGDMNCESNSCLGGVCAAPRGDDGIKNGDESDVDCGGSKTGAPRCGAGKTCNGGSDCASTGCSYQKVCVERPSCAPHMGGDTCGPGEPDDPENQNESCCTALELPVPDGPVLMDKYQITAGRFRVFLDAVHGDVRTFVRQRRPRDWDPLWDDFVPNGWDVDPGIPADSDPEFLKRAHSSVWHQLGGTALLTRLGRDGEPFRYGCNIDGNGTHTYRMPDDVQTNVLMDVPHKYSQEILDQKPLNCATALMLMAFCEWDWPGSRLPTYEETRFAWHKGRPSEYLAPWGNTPAPVGFQWPDAVFPPSTVSPEPTGRFGAEAVVPLAFAGVAGELDYTNWKYNYVYPEVPWPSEMAPDQSAYISAPGRFPKGNGPFGHADLAGNLFDLTSTIAGSPGMHPDDRELTWGRNGAWEGHPLPFASEDKPWTAPIMRKYAKAGGRCVAPR